MSLVAFAVRASLVRLLRDATLAGAQVHDSPLDPVAQTAASAGSPLINVYCEADTLFCDGSRALLQGNRTVNVTLQMFLPVNETVKLGGSEIETSTRKGGGQAIFDVIHRQIEASLTLEHTPNVWRDIFTVLVTGYTSTASRPYVIETQKGVRLAARELEMVCETLNSPPFGVDPPPVWQKFMAAMAEDAGLAPILPVIRSALTADIALSPDEIDTSLLGLSYYEAVAAGFAPIVRGSEIGEVAVTVDGPDGDQIVVPGPALSEA